MQRGYFHRYVLKLHDDDEDCQRNAAGRRRKTHRKPPSPDEVIALCHEVLVLKHHHIDVARRHNMAVNAVSRYICKAKKSKSFVDELYAKERDVRCQTELVSGIISNQVASGKIINSAKDIYGQVPPGTNGK
jgi:hypothetical protein